MPYRVDKISLIQSIVVVFIFGYLFNVVEDVDLKYLVFFSYVIFDLGFLILFSPMKHEYYQDAYRVVQNHQRACVYMILIMLIFDMIATFFVCLLHSIGTHWQVEHFAIWIVSFMVIGWLGQTVQKPNNA